MILHEVKNFIDYLNVDKEKEPLQQMLSLKLFSAIDIDNPKTKNVEVVETQV